MAVNTAEEGQGCPASRHQGMEKSSQNLLCWGSGGWLEGHRDRLNAYERNSWLRHGAGDLWADVQSHLAAPLGPALGTTALVPSVSPVPAGATWIWFLRDHLCFDVSGLLKGWCQAFALPALGLCQCGNVGGGEPAVKTLRQGEQAADTRVSTDEPEAGREKLVLLWGPGTLTCLGT